MAQVEAAENPAIPGNFSNRLRAGLWNNAPIPLMPFFRAGHVPAPTPNT
jgi:hypothetical protein